jgi:hypothetical protein
MQDVCDAFLFSQLPYDIPPLLSYLMILLSLYITIPSSFIVFASIRSFHLIARVVNFVVTVVLVFALSGEFGLEDSMAFATNWTSFFTMPVLGY